MRFRYIHIIAALFLIIGMGVQIVVSYRSASDRVQERMNLEMQVAQEKLIFRLYDAYDAVYQMNIFMDNEMDDVQELLEETHKIMERFPHFFSCFVAFPPYRFPDEGKWYALTSYRARDSIVSVNYGDAKHDYFLREWYSGAIESGETGFWSTPYRDDDFDEPIFTFADDIRDDNGELVCVIGLDFSVKWLQNQLEQFKPFSEVAFMLYNTDGELITSSSNLSETDLAHLTDASYVMSRKVLMPLNIEMVMAVPDSYIWDNIWLGILMPSVIFVLGIIIVAFLIQRLVRVAEENARLGTEKEVMAHELTIAHGIQMGILKGEKGTLEGERANDVEIHADLVPMKEVGGDLYDYRLVGDTLWFIIGDVSGKGVPAAMFMSATVNLFRAAGRHVHSPKDLMEEMNAVLSENNPSLTFVTAFIGRLHIPSGKLIYCNAGHCAPLIANSSRHTAVSLQTEPNIPLGYDGRYAFVEQGCMIGEGEKIVLYTDGVTEARNSKRQMLGMKRWTTIVASTEALPDAIGQYIGEAEPTDDITLMTIRKLSAVEPVTMRVPNRDDQWPELRHAIHEYGICAGMEKRMLKKLEMAAEEVVVNILRYSQATEIEMAVWCQDSAFSIQFADDGTAFDPTTYEPKPNAAEERQIGGLGITLVRQIADEIHYERSDGRNVLTLVKLLNR